MGCADRPAADPLSPVLRRAHPAATPRQPLPQQLTPWNPAPFRVLSITGLRALHPSLITGKSGRLRPSTQPITRSSLIGRRATGLDTGDIGGNVVAMSFAPLPVTAAWQHRGLRSGFEVVYFSAAGDRCRMEGWTTAVEDGATWVVEYAIEVDAAGATRSAVIRGRSAAGSCTARLEADGNGRWLVDGQPAPGLDGCLDVD